jgi:hypothetical protein
MDMQQGHSARTCSKHMQDGHSGRDMQAWTCRQGHAGIDMQPWTCTMDMHHGQATIQHGHALCTRYTDMLHGHKYGEATWLRHAAMKCTLDMQKEHARWICSMNIQQGRGA